MNNIKTILQSFKANWKTNSLKIISLAVGFAFGLVLLAKVYFDNSFDGFYPNTNHIYKVEQIFSENNKVENKRFNVPGAIAPGMAREVPGVLKATRYTGLGRNLTIKTSNNQVIKTSAILADSLFYDVLPRPMVTGNSKEILAVPNQVMISQSMAKKMGGINIGEVIEFERYPNIELTIAGVFKDNPYNSTIQYDMAISLPTLSQFMGDGSNNWIGNDRYNAFVVLDKNVDPNSLNQAIRAMQEKNQGLERLHENNVDLNYSLHLFKDIHTSNPSVRKSNNLLTTLAIILFLVSILNYVMLTTFTLFNQTRKIALHRCYGAGNRDIIKMVYSETLIYILSSLLLAGLILYSCRPIIETMIGEQIHILFSIEMILFLLSIIALVFIITGVIPAYLYVRTPILNALHKFKNSNKKWKLALLFVQFISVAVLVTFLGQVKLQYQTTITQEVGYEYENLLYINFPSPDTLARQTTINELQKLSFVTNITTASEHLFYWPSGNNVLLLKTNKELFNTGDLYGVADNYLETMKIELLDGEHFNESSQRNDVLVSQRFRDELNKFIDTSTGVIGMDILITEHGICNIKGVYKDFSVTSLLNPDRRPTVMFYNPSPSDILIIELNELNSENKQIIDKSINTTLNNEHIATTIYSQTIKSLYNSEKQMGNIIMTGSLIALLMSLIGLIGYLQTEVKLRSKEIAVRKINGASFKDLAKLMSSEILYLAIPSILVGCAIAYYLATIWMKDFALQEFLAPLHYLVIGCFILLLILTITLLQLRSINNMNPIDTLRDE